MTTPLLPFALLAKNLKQEADINCLKKLMKLDYDLNQFLDRILSDVAINNRKFYFAIFDIFEDLVQYGFMQRVNLKSRRSVHNRELFRYEPTQRYLEVFEPTFVQNYVSNYSIKVIAQNERINIQTKYLQLMTSAASRMLDFDLTVSDVKNLLNRKTCYYTNLPFEQNTESPFYRTIDRIDSNLGYIKGNVVACCSFVNQVKNDLLETGTGRQLQTKQIRQTLELFSSILNQKEDKVIYKNVVHHLKSLKKEQTTIKAMANYLNISVDTLLRSINTSDSSLVKVSKNTLSL